MERHEIKALVDARMEEGKRTLDTMKARLDATTGEAAADYRERVAQLKREHDELKARAARSLEVADEAFDAACKDLELAMDEWDVLAKRTFHGLPK
jgi:hypothetical protein